MVDAEQYSVADNRTPYIDELEVQDLARTGRLCTLTLYGTLYTLALGTFYVGALAVALADVREFFTGNFAWRAVASALVCSLGTSFASFSLLSCVCVVGFVLSPYMEFFTLRARFMWEHLQWRWKMSASSSQVVLYFCVQLHLLLCAGLVYSSPMCVGSVPP